MDTTQEEVRKRLLLALLVVTGQREPQSLSVDEALLLGFDIRWGMSFTDQLIMSKCSNLLVAAIIAGGYR